MAIYIKQGARHEKDGRTEGLLQTESRTKRRFSRIYPKTMCLSFGHQPGGSIACTGQCLGCPNRTAWRGYSVTLDDWSTFKATIGLEEGKEMDTIDGNESKRNARSLCLDGVNFQADKKLVHRGFRL